MFSAENNNEFEVAKAAAQSKVDAINALVGKQVARVIITSGENNTNISINVDDDVMTQHQAKDSDDLLQKLMTASENVSE